jgi:hypothetical protein
MIFVTAYSVGMYAMMIVLLRLLKVEDENMKARKHLILQHFLGSTTSIQQFE